MTVLLRPAADDDLPAIGALHFWSRATAYAGIAALASRAARTTVAAGSFHR